MKKYRGLPKAQIGNPLQGVTRKGNYLWEDNPDINAPYPSVKFSDSGVQLTPELGDMLMEEGSFSSMPGFDKFAARFNPANPIQKGRTSITPVTTSPPPAPKEEPWNPYMTLRGATTGLSWLANKADRNRQDQYMYNQMSTLGQMNPANVNDYQPNPYNLYAQKGGSLKKYQQGGFDEAKEFEKQWMNSSIYKSRNVPEEVTKQRFEAVDSLKGPNIVTQEYLNSFVPEEYKGMKPLAMYNATKHSVDILPKTRDEVIAHELFHGSTKGNLLTPSSENIDSETRARLQTFRQAAQQEGVIDPFKEEFNKTHLRGMKRSKALGQIKSLFKNDDELLKYLGSTSQTNQQSIPMAQDGGQFGLQDPRKVALNNIARTDNTNIQGIPIQLIASDLQAIKDMGESKKIINAKELVRRKKAISQSNINNTPATSAAGDKLRLFPDDPNSFIDEYLNPLKMVGDMADDIGHNLGNPNSSIGQTALSLAAPLAMGAIGSIGAKNTGQFINNTFNPIPLGSKEEFLDIIKTLKNNKLKNVTISKEEQELLNSTRLIGHLVNSGDINTSISILQSLKNKANNLDDIYFEKLTGFKKSEIDGKIKLLNENNSKKQNITASDYQPGSYRPDYESEIQDVNINEFRDFISNNDDIDELGMYRFNFTTGSPQFNILNDRINELASNRQIINGFVEGTPEFEQLQERITELRNNNTMRFLNDGINNRLRSQDFINYGYFNNNFRKESLFSKIKNKLDKTEKIKPLNDAESLIGSLNKRRDNNPAREILEAYNKVKNSEKGKSFIPSSSLSSDSYNRLSLPLIERGLKENIIDLNYHGLSPLNLLGFPTKAGIKPELILKEINSKISDINKITNKKYPFAKLNNSDIFYPNFSVTRKKLGGVIKMNKLQDGGQFGLQNPRDIARNMANPNTNNLAKEEAAMEIYRRNKATDKRKFLNPTTANTLLQEEQRRLKNKAYATKNPNVAINQFGDLSRVNQDRDFEGNADNFMSQRQDKANEHINNALLAASVIMPAGTLLKKGIKQTGKYLTEQTALKNAYKLNPYAFKPNPESYYRMIGKEGYKDALESGVVRANPNNIHPWDGTQIYNEPYFSKGIPLDRDWKSPLSKKIGSIYKGPNMVEVNDASKFKASDSFVSSPNSELSSFDPYVKFYKEDWLRGYKDISPKQSGDVFWNGKSYQSTPLSNPRVISSSSGMDAVLAKQPGYNSHLFKKQGYIPPTTDPKLMARLKNEVDIDKKLIQESKNFKYDNEILNKWFKTSPSNEFGMEMRGIMKRYGFNSSNTDDIEKFRTLYIQSQQKMFLDNLRPISYGDKVLHNTLNKNKLGGLIKKRLRSK